MTPPEIFREKTTPVNAMARLRLLRERYVEGEMSAARFNAILEAFRFVDEVGHLWSPGAQSERWYRWDRTQWTMAEPPAVLALADPKLADQGAWVESAHAESLAGPRCARCSAALNPSAAFCSACGHRAAQPAAPPRPPAPQPPYEERQPPAQPSTCPNPSCRQPLRPGKKFCGACGAKLP